MTSACFDKSSGLRWYRFQGQSSHHKNQRGLPLETGTGRFRRTGCRHSESHHLDARHNGAELDPGSDTPLGMAWPYRPGLYFSGVCNVDGRINNAVIQAQNWVTSPNPEISSITLIAFCSLAVGSLENGTSKASLVLCQLSAVVSLDC